MIATRTQLLDAIRLAEPTASGLTVGPCAMVAGRDITFGKVKDAATKRNLIQKIKLAPSRVFANEFQWNLPHVRTKPTRKTKLSSKTGSTRRPGRK